MLNGILAPDLQAVIESLRRRREVVAVYLFGSHARGEARSDSDVDLCVVLDPGWFEQFPRKVAESSSTF